MNNELDSVPAVENIAKSGDLRTRCVGIRPAIVISEISKISSAQIRSIDIPCPIEGFAARTYHLVPSGIVAEFRPNDFMIFAPRASRIGEISSKSRQASDKVCAVDKTVCLVPRIFGISIIQNNMRHWMSIVFPFCLATGTPLLVCRERPGHDDTLRFLTKRIRMEWTHAKSNRNFIVHVMQHKNDPEWLRTVILSVAQQQNINNRQKRTKNIGKGRLLGGLGGGGGGGEESSSGSKPRKRRRNIEGEHKAEESYCRMKCMRVHLPTPAALRMSPPPVFRWFFW